MSESGYYPPGAEHDPRAPWNQPEPVACEKCNGVGDIADPDGIYPTIVCPECGGSGTADADEDDGPDPDDLRDREYDRQVNGE